MTRLISKFLGLPEEIDHWGHHHWTHLYRWTILNNKRFQVFLDHSDTQDWEGNLQNYPERFFSVGIAQSGEGTQVYPDRAAWLLLVGRSQFRTKH